MDYENPARLFVAIDSRRSGTLFLLAYRTASGLPKSARSPLQTWI
jgi:hypothetical protein